MWDFGKWTRMHAREFAYWIVVDISEEVYSDGSVTHRPPQASVELYSLDTPEEVYEVADGMRSVRDFLKSRPDTHRDPSVCQLGYERVVALIGGSLAMGRGWIGARRYTWQGQ